jgi:predicted aspartyl protease
VPARQINTRMLVGVTIDGKGPFRFFVDSGADRSVVGVALAERLALPPGPTVILHSTGNARPVQTVRVGSLQLGGSRITDLAAPALPERFLGADGMVGIDALAQQRVTIDFFAKAVTVEDTRRPPPPAADDEVVVTARRRKGQLILTQASVGGVPISAVIDTGTEVTVGNDALRRRLTRRRNVEVKKITLISVAGDLIQADLITVPELIVGTLRVANVPIAFTDLPPFKLFGLDDAPAVLLGTDVMGVFRRVSMDFGRKKIRFTKPV